jgi:lysozyme
MDREKFKKLLTLHEGYKEKLYIDTVGVPTVGIGFNLDHPVPKPVIDLWFELLIAQHEKELVTALPWLNQLDEVRYAVLLNMAYNLGVPGLLKFKQTLTAVKRGDYDQAASLMLQSKWAMQVGKRAVTLSNMMRLGKYPD